MVVPGCLAGKQCVFLHLLHLLGGCGKDLSLQRGRSPLFLRVLVHTCMGEARLSGHNLESRVGCLVDCGGLSLLMKPWCAEGDVPTAANLNLYRGWNSCVGWHRDDEPLFGKCGESKAHCFSELWDSGAFQMER